MNTDFPWNSQMLAHFLLNSEGAVQDALKAAVMQKLSDSQKRELELIFNGQKLPSFCSDIVFKKILDPEEHAERLNWLLREIAKDTTIEVDSGYSNEGTMQSYYGKKVIFDVPVTLVDNRLSNLEMQVSAQDFIFERAEIYSSNFLVMQYSVRKGVKKKTRTYSNTAGVLLIILMKNSPKIFDDFKTDHYIHRFNRRVSDSGIEYETLNKTVYVQLDKCFKQFKKGIDSENNYELQSFLSMLYNQDNAKVKALAQYNTRMSEVYQEVSNFSKTKEVQAMLLAEQFINADLDALKSYERKEGAAAEKELAFNEKREAAKEMLSDGVSVNKIHKYLKLPMEIITELQKEFNRENPGKDNDSSDEDEITDEHPLLDSFGDMDELKRIQEEMEQEKRQQKESATSTTNSGKVDKGTKLPKMNIKSNHKF